MEGEIQLRRLVRNIPTQHVSEIISNIIHIYVCDDVKKEYVNFASSTVLSSQDGDISDDQYYLTFSDDQLLQLSDEDILSISDVQLIARIAKLDRSRLSADQLKSLKDSLSTKYVIDKSDIEEILFKMKRCNSISYERRHRETNSFLFDSKGNFRAKECLEIIKNLDVEDYVASTKSFNINYLGNNLIIFEPDADWVLSDGSTVYGLTIYVKLDIDESNGNTVALVSMHETEYDSEKPYDNHSNT